MKPYKVVMTGAAARDLDDLFDYVADHDSIERADQVVAKIEEAISKLDLFPERGAHPRELLAVGIRQYREIHYKPYRIVYRSSATQVNVVLIVDGRRDMRALLARRLLGA
jgi:toxin ParE1/3/4